MPFTIPEITEKYIGELSLEQFAQSLGIGASRQMVWYWKEGKQKPMEKTLLAVFRSQDSTVDAKQWARECFFALTGVELEPNIDLEVERRR